MFIWFVKLYYHNLASAINIVIWKKDSMIIGSSKHTNHYVKIKHFKLGEDLNVYCKNTWNQILHQDRLLYCNKQLQSMNHNFSPQQLKRLQLYFIEIEGTSLSKLNSKYRLAIPFRLSSQPLQNTILQRLVTENIKFFPKQPNSNLIAYSYMLLITIYNDSLDENLLNLVKSLLFDPSLILTQIYNAPFPNVSSDELKKVIVEFIFQLQFTDYSKSLHKNIQKYPIVLYLLAIFLRGILAKYGLTSALDYQLEVSTQTGFELLNELMDINYRHVNNSYLFLESQTIIIQLQSSLIALGKYQQSSSCQSENTIKYEVNLNQFEKISHNFMFESNIRESQYIDGDAPTPCFNWNSQQKNYMRQSNRTQRKGGITILNQNASVPIMKHSPNIMEDKQCSVKSSQIDQSLQQNLYLLKNEDYGWKSPIFNNGIVMDDVANAFDLFQMANKQKFTGKAISQNDQLPRSLDISENSNQDSIKECSCKRQVRAFLKLCSKVYQVNHFTVKIGIYQKNDLVQDSMLISMKNIFSSSQLRKKAINRLDLSQQQGKNSRSKTFHEVINHSFSDFDHSLEDFQNRINFKLAKTGHASINSSQFQSKNTSKAYLILEDKSFATKLPKINFTYSNKSLINQNINKV